MLVEKFHSSPLQFSLLRLRTHRIHLLCIRLDLTADVDLLKPYDHVNTFCIEQGRSGRAELTEYTWLLLKDQTTLLDVSHMPKLHVQRICVLKMVPLDRLQIGILNVFHDRSVIHISNLISR
jgi:hypothetical protein